jgi:hypothetical protein
MYTKRRNQCSIDQRIFRESLLEVYCQMPTLRQSIDSEYRKVVNVNTDRSTRVCLIIVCKKCETESVLKWFFFNFPCNKLLFFLQECHLRSIIWHCLALFHQMLPMEDMDILSSLEFVPLFYKRYL